MLLPSARDPMGWADAAHDLVPADREELLRHGARSLARRSVRDTGTYVILSVALVFTTSILREHAALALGTILGCAAVGGARFLLSRSFDRVYDRAPGQWRKLFGVATLALGCLWALFCYSVTAGYGLKTPSLLVMFATAALSAGAVSSLCPDRRLLTAFLLLMLAPIVLAAALPGRPHNLSMSLAVALYCGVLIKEGRFQSRHYWKSMGNVFRLRARTADLERARALAENASRAKSGFLAHMSHEIRTPLNGVLGMLHLMRDTPLNEVQREYADTMQRSAETLLGVLNGILDLSKIEAGRMTFETVDFDIREMLEDVGTLVSPSAHAKGVELAVRVPPGFPRLLRGDARRLREVIENLASNAAKFTEQGEVAIELELREQTSSGASFRITVRDTGIGIPRDRQQAVFEGFTQAEGSTSRRYGGTGLGLAISRQLVSLMGGTMALESEPGRGTTFRIDLRLEKQPGAESEKPEASGLKLHGLRVLVADDNATSRGILREQLRALGCEVECVANGPGALEALARGPGRSPVALVLLDSGTPGLDGFAVAEAIRAEARFTSMPIVMLLATGGADPASEPRRLGIAASLHKPVRFLHLRRAVAAATGAAGEPSEPAQVPRLEVMGLSKLGLRVLIAEDHTVNQAVAVRMCERLGVGADVATNGREAVAAFERRRYDAVLMDLQMPEMDGLEATRRIRHLERARGGRVPIIALTAQAMTSDIERCREAGMDDYVSKPFHPDDLFRALRTWCGSAGSAATGPGRAGSAPAVPVLNLQQLLMVTGSDVAFERNLREDFLQGIPQLLADADAALAAGDGPRLRALAHRLKGSSRTIGGDAVGDACEALENTAEHHGLDGALAALRILRSEMARLEGALRSRNLKAA